MHPTAPAVRLPSVLCALLLCPALAAQASPGATRLTIDKMLDLERVGGPVLSPDGKQIVFTRSWCDKMEDKTRSDLWIMDADGDRQRFLVKGSSPRWSPDGTRIAYLAAGEPTGSQVHVLWLADRSSTQITRLEHSPSGIRWSPDGRMLAFNMQVPGKPAIQVKLPERPKGAKWAPEPRVVSRLNYRRDRRGYNPSGFRHIFVVDAGGGTPRQVTAGDFDHGAPRWSVDGNSLFFSGLREADADWKVRESDLYRVEAATGVVHRLTDRPGGEYGPEPSPDGARLAYLSRPKNEDTYDVASIRIVSLAKPKDAGRTVFLDRAPGNLTWRRDGKALYVTYRDHGDSHAWEIPIDGEPRQLTKGHVQFSIADVGTDGTVVGTMTSPHAPGDIWSIAPSGEARQLTRVNDDVLAGVQLGAVEELRYRSVGDFEIQGWIVKPPDFDPAKKYPLILQIHGGPHGMYGVDFSFERQNHAAEGYVVLYTNPRGSAGYGKAFGNAINNAYPGHDFDDLMKGVDEVIARGYIDEKNLFVYGGSGGGVLTCWIVGHTNRFAAAVSMFPVTNWISFVGTTDGPYWYTNFQKLPWEDIEEHWRRSPLKYVGNVKTPTMLITGELDLRTPMAQTEEYYQALKLRKVDTLMVRVPDEYHGAAGRHVSNGLRRILYVRKWFEKYRTPAAVVETSARTVR